MDYLSILVCVRLSCILMTSLGGSGATVFTALEAVGVGAVISQEATIQARSRIECAVHCRRYPYCTSFTYSQTDSVCYLHPVTSGDTQTSKTAVVFTEESKKFLKLKIFTTISPSLFIEHVFKGR